MNLKSNKDIMKSSAPEAMVTPGSGVELEDGFHDYTISSTLEKLIASLENGIRNLLLMEIHEEKDMGEVRIAHGLPFRSEDYFLRLQASRGSQESWQLADHGTKLHNWFGPLHYLVLSPDTYSGRILDPNEYRTLLSAASIALSNISHEDNGRLSLFLPVFDALRDAYYGVSIHKCGIVRLETDSIHGRQSKHTELGELHGRLQFLGKQIGAQAPNVAIKCEQLAQSLQMNEDVGNLVFPQEWSAFSRCIFQLCARPEGEKVMYVGEDYLETWDLDLLWYPWAQQNDPIGMVWFDCV